MVLAVLLLVLALVMTSNANFAKGYVKDQLSQQKIAFPTAAILTAEEKQSPCLVRYAGLPLTTGKQAECYANDFIGLHVKAVANGLTYSELGAPQADLRTQIAAAQKANDPGLAGLQKQLTDVTAQRETLFKGETLRGLLLTSFGFSVFGVKGEQVATVAYSVAALLALLSLAGLVHAFRTPRTRTLAMLEHVDSVPDERQPVRT
jgi:chromate transport protein ChrA